MEERRKHKRYLLDNVCIINHSTIVGTVVDLSVGGLSCKCLDQGSCGEGNLTTVDLYCKSHDISAEGIEMEILSTESLRGKFVEDIGMRTCRAQFRQLDEAKLEELANIIGEASNPFQAGKEDK